MGSLKSMVPHRQTHAAAPTRREHGRRARDSAPLDSDWLAEQARSYAARWEASEAGVATLLERKIQQRCLRTGESPEAALELIPAVIARLVELNYVNDIRFGQNLLERERRRGSSSRKIRAKLLTRGISTSTLDEILSGEESDAEIRAAWRLAERRRLGPHARDLDERDSARQRQLAIFDRAGFDLSCAMQILDAESIPERD